MVVDAHMEITLRPGRERSVLLRHPWIYSGAIADVRGDPGPGDTVEVFSSDGDWLARAAYSATSQIRARLWTWRREEDIDSDFFLRRLRQAIGARAGLYVPDWLTAYREVHAESDGIPGLIIDRYNEFRVVQILSAGAERWREAIVSGIEAISDSRGIYERSEADVRQLEGLQPRSGHLWGEEPPEDLQILENGLRFRVDVHQGHKTGFYLDQRDNRQLVRESVPPGEVLDCFAYTGAFTVAALVGGAAHVTAIESSDRAWALAQDNLRLNGLAIERCEWAAADVFAELRRLRDRARSFEAVILDPPRFAPTASQVQRAARAYKDINLLAFKLLRPGGMLYTFSCSSGVGPDLFQKIIAGAAHDAGVEASITAWPGQPRDHPVGLSFPEGRYLKGLVCRVAGAA